MNEEKHDTLPCPIVRDILPLYHDGVVSAETRSAVEEHLMECESCRAEYEAMEKQLPVKGAEPSTKKRFLAMVGRQKRKKIIAVVLAAVLAAAAAVGGISALSEFCIVPLDWDRCELMDVCKVETPEGRKAFVRWSHDYGGSIATWRSLVETDDGVRVEIEVKHPVLEWVSEKGVKRVDQWFVPIEGDLEEVRFNGQTVWTEPEDGI